MLPYLVVKRAEAEVALAYWAKRQASKGSGKRGNPVTMPLAQQEHYANALKELRRLKSFKYRQASEELINVTEAK